MESIGIIGRLIPAHGNNQRSSGGYFLRKFQLSTVEGQFCTMVKHLIHSDAVLRVKGQECKGVKDQMYPNILQMYPNFPEMYPCILMVSMCVIFIPMSSYFI